MSPRHKNRRKIYGLLPLTIGLLLCLGTASALAFDVCFNGVPVELTTRPSLKQGKAMLPLECLASPLGLDIECEGVGDTISLLMQDRAILLSGDSTEAIVNGIPVDLGVSPYWKENQIMVPINFVVDALGLSVGWDEGGQVLQIKGDIESPQETPITAPSQKKSGVPAGGRQGEPLQEEAIHQEEPDLPSTEDIVTREIEKVTTEQGTHPLQLTRVLEEMRAQTLAFAEEGFRKTQGTRLVGVLPTVEQGRQRLDFITDAKVEVEPMLLVEPPRLVLDVAGATIEAIDDELYVGQGVIHRVRLSQYQDGIARAVVDLAETTGYQIEKLTDGNGFSVVFNRRIGRVKLWRRGSTVGLCMETSGPVQYSVRRLTSPQRIVVDVDHATFVAGTAEVSVNDSAVKALRISQYTPTTSRIVIELEHNLEIVDIDGGTSDSEIELAFQDPQWVKAGDLESLVRGEPKASWQAAGELPLLGLRQLASLGQSLVNLFPSGRALAMEETKLTEISTTPHEVEQDLYHSAALLEESNDGVDSETGSVVVGENWQEPAKQSDEPFGFSVPFASEEMPLEPRFREMDFSKWPRLQPNWITANERAALAGRRVLLDAGHGGFQPGAPGVKGVWEKTYNLELVLRVGELLEWAGAHVSYTRIDDRTVSLGERVGMAEVVNAEILLSVHANASLAKDATGTETLFHSGLEASRLLAKSLQENLVGQLGLPDRGIKQRKDLYILRHSPIPSALVEVGFLDHAEEGVFLLTPEAIDKASMGLVRGIATFFRDNPLPRPAEIPAGLKEGVEPLDGGAKEGVEGSEADSPLSRQSAGSDTDEQKL